MRKSSPTYLLVSNGVHLQVFEKRKGKYMIMRTPIETIQITMGFTELKVSDGEIGSSKQELAEDVLL